jgi:hypothetical protein
MRFSKSVEGDDLSMPAHFCSDVIVIVAEGADVDVVNIDFWMENKKREREKCIEFLV